MSEKKLIGFLKNLSYTFSANIISLLINVMIILIIPKALGLVSYGYYQLYTFYYSYVGIMYFGWCEGIYLREGGKYYEDLDKPLYSTQFRLLGLCEIIIYLLIFIGSLFLVDDRNKHIVIGCTCIVAVGMCLRWFITTLLQATSRIKEFAIVTLCERILFIVFVLIHVLYGYHQYYYLIFDSIVSVYVSLAIGIWYCRDIVFSKGYNTNNFKFAVKEIKANVIAGIKLQISTVCGLLIIGVVRFGIERHWDISTFGKVSLTLSISNMVVTAINAISVVMYPTLRRTSQERLPQIYSLMRIMLMGLIFGVLTMYYPMMKILSAWLPQYAESLRYAAILFPICAYESKVSMLVNTYYKSLRMENLLMKCNMASLALSVVCTFISTVVLNSVTMAILSILFVLIFRCVICELLLSKRISINVTKDIIIEIVMTIAFIINNWFFDFLGMLVYIVMYIGYLALKQKDIKEAVNFVKAMR